MGWGALYNYDFSNAKKPFKTVSDSANWNTWRNLEASS